MANALARETSPYLRQHKDNPVDWMPWGDEAFARARERDCPLLVSIGYSACHWCHVMERESFEDPQVAALMNERFVCVKVDREERPDVDAIYMDAVQAMTGQGGWPLHAFITHDGTPFFTGTYFPPRPQQGQMSWSQLCEAVAAAWKSQRSRLEGGMEPLLARLRGSAALDGRTGDLPADVCEQAATRLRAVYDGEHGGFGGAPKFPMASVLEFLLGQDEREMSVHSLRAMANGGIYDQIGGGFARYSTDARWLVPHFEKMLYDNALLARVYLHGWQRTGDALLRRVCEETLDFMLRELRQPEGGFASALDADSEGVEGRFYVWRIDEVPDAAARAFGMTAAGNWEGVNIPVRATSDPPNFAELKAELLALRERRVRPGLDDKRLTSWNALAVAALADAGAVLGRPDYLDAARTTADFLLTAMRDGDGRLLRTFNHGRARLRAYLEDHAYLLEALLTLYEATFEDRWFESARALADETIFRFGDPERGGFFTTAHDHEQLLVRRRGLEDNPIPSGQSSAALGLLRLSALTGEGGYAEQARMVMRPLAEPATRYPQAFGHLLQAFAFARGPVREVALVGPEADAFAAVVRSEHRPLTVVAASPAVPLMDGRTEPGAYVCENLTCRAPVASPEELATALD